MFELVIHLETSGLGQSGSLLDSPERKTASSIAEAGEELYLVELLCYTDTVGGTARSLSLSFSSSLQLTMLTEIEELRDGPNGSESEVAVVVAREFRHIDSEGLWLQDEATYYFGNDSESVVPTEAARAYRCFDREELWLQDESTYYFCKVLQTDPGSLAAHVCILMLKPGIWPTGTSCMI